jgi:hypothetical protein
LMLCNPICIIRQGGISSIELDVLRELFYTVYVLFFTLGLIVAAAH